VLLNTPHLLCQYTCSAADQVVAEKPKCPHCPSEPTSTPSAPTPTDDCKLGCCDQEPGVLVAAEVLGMAQGVCFLQPLADLDAMYTSTDLSDMKRVAYWPPPPSSHPGSQLTIFLGRFLL
jgi:hypothetical protein